MNQKPEFKHFSECETIIVYWSWSEDTHLWFGNLFDFHFIVLTMGYKFWADFLKSPNDKGIAFLNSALGILLTITFYIFCYCNIWISLFKKLWSGDNAKGNYRRNL